MSTTEVYHIPVLPLPGGTFQTMGTGSGSGSCSCDSSGSQECCGPDVAAWFIQQLSKIKTFAVTLTIGSSKYKEFWSTIKFENANLNSKNCPGNSCADTVTLCKTCISVTELGNIAYGYAAGRGIDPVLGINANSLTIMLWGGFYADVEKGRGFSSTKEIASALAGAVLNAHLGSNGNDFCELLTKPRNYNQNYISGVIDNLGKFDALNMLHLGYSILGKWNNKHKKTVGSWDENIRNSFAMLERQGGALSGNAVKDCECCEQAPSSPKSIKPNPDTGVVSWE